MSTAAPRRAPAPGRRPEPRAAGHLRVAPDAPRRRAPVAFWVGVAASVAAVFVLVAFHVLAVQHAFAMDRIVEQRRVEEQRYERLRRDVATLSSPEAIVRAAERLGMVVAPTVDYIDVPPAAPTGESADETASTLAQSWDDAKGSLGP